MEREKRKTHKNKDREKKKKKKIDGETSDLIAIDNGVKFDTKIYFPSTI